MERSAGMIGWSFTGKPDKFTGTAHCDPGIDMQALEEQLGKKYVGTQGLISGGGYNPE